MDKISIVPPAKNENRKITPDIFTLLDSFFFYTLITYLNYCYKPSYLAKLLDFNDSKLWDELKGCFKINDEYLGRCQKEDFCNVCAIDLSIMVLIIYLYDIRWVVIM
jgi:hypothetical protein